ncbi:glutathione S-transferase [Thioalkalivibrio denitrificans]|uniref:Glutathione S-transferase n=1 Tax=Thioalkalivibrio denitrificans TaxID=108003 RepID=A0A1V3NG03_9GAMM|nr:glutathione S-transferase family protein [Thioalkalivibrio denitrificans]OOG23782.1 glutathione S-transferase [Thioalkalivibrio denitrificans]
MQLKLVSFDLCPYVQRSVVTLLYKNADFQVAYIDLQDPPEWFLEISPLSKVPLLLVDGDTVLFESAVINEFVDDITPPRLQPEDPLARALDRGWVEYGSQCIMDQYRVMTAPDAAAFEEVGHTAVARLARLENHLGEGPWFNGERFSLVDATFAAVLMRWDILNRRHPVFEPDQFPRLERWWKALSELPAVRESVPADLEEKLMAYLRRRGGHGAAVFAGQN